MNITLSADERIVEAARSWAAAHGTSINSLIRDYLASLNASVDTATAAELFAKNAKEKARTSAPGTDFSRRALYRGRRFGTPE